MRASVCQYSIVLSKFYSVPPNVKNIRGPSWPNGKSSPARQYFSEDSDSRLLINVAFMKNEALGFLIRATVN